MTLRRTALIAAATAAIGASLIAAPLAAASTAGVRTAPSSEGRTDGQDQGHDDNEDSFTIGLWGDMPYIKGAITQSLALGGVDQVITDMNTQSLAFTVFDGDIKAGNSSYCGTDPKSGYNPYDNAKTMFGKVTAPTVYTPGDNEWTDCDRAKNGALDPNAQLDYLRKTFFASPLSQGANPMRVEQQSLAYPENARWTKDDITFITINVPGTDNNAPQYMPDGVTPQDPDGKAVVPPAKQNGDLAEYTARNAANLAWLEDSFRYAQKRGSKGIMIVQQGDMWATNGDITTHYADEKAKLADLVSRTKRPVVLVNGDSHVFAVDQPLTDANGKPLANFTRVTTDGEGRFGWTKVTVTPEAKQVFTFEQHVLQVLPV